MCYLSFLWLNTAKSKPTWSSRIAVWFDHRVSGLGCPVQPETHVLPILKGFLSTQVYKRLEGLQAVPPWKLEVAGHGSPSPQENSYMSTTGSAQSGDEPWQPLVVTTRAPAQAAQQLQRSPNQPVESDESVPGLSATLHSWHLTPDSHPSPVSFREASCTQGGTTRESSLRSGPGFQPTTMEGSSMGSSSLLSSEPPQIIINPARQKMVQKLALYEEGVLDSLQLLSSGFFPGTCRWL